MDLAAGGGALMWAVMASIGVIVVLYATERFSIELISAGVIAFFLLLFQIFPAPVPEGQSFGPAELLSGFANPALITIMALLVRPGHVPDRRDGRPHAAPDGQL